METVIRQRAKSNTKRILLTFWHSMQKFSYSYKCYDSTASSFHLTFSVNKHALMDFLTKKRQHNSNKKVFQNLFLEGKQSKCMKKQKRNKKRKNKQKTVKNFQTA